MSTVHAATIARQAAPVLRVRACDYDFASGYLKQGIGVATGLQHSFSWQSVAASAVGAGVGQAVGPVFGEAFGNTAAGQFGARLATGLVAGTAAAVMRGGKIAVQQVATDAFANAIGSSLVDQSQPQPDNTQLATGDFARMDRELYNQQQWSAQSDAIQARRFAEIDTYKAASMGINDLPSDYVLQGPTSPQVEARGQQILEGMRDAEVAAMSAPRGVQAYANTAAIGAGPSSGPMTFDDLRRWEIQKGNEAAAAPRPFQQRLLQPGEDIKGNLFFGGAGMDGAYIPGFVRAFGDKGVALTPVDARKWSASGTLGAIPGMLVDAGVGVDIYSKGQFPVQVLLDNFKQSGTQFNMVGYSYGSVAAAQVAANYAQAGTRVDNLVLIGTPISKEFLQQLQSTENIKNVIVVDLTEHGDPIHPGISRTELMNPKTLFDMALVQMPNDLGHFYYAGTDAASQVRRDNLAQYLYSKGLR